MDISAEKSNKIGFPFNSFAWFYQAILKHISLWILWLILAMGIVLRIVRYGSNRSLWYDEAMLAVAIIGRPLSNLLNLEFGQVAPWGFVFIEKCSTLVFGTSEYALRLFPLIASILGLVLFHQILRQWYSRWIAAFALMLLALSRPAIYFSAEVKQYSIELCGTIFLIWLVDRLRKNNSFQTIAALALGGCTVLWLSFPAVFITGAIGGALVFESLTKKNYRLMHAALLCIGCWSISFLAEYFLTINKFAVSDSLQLFWQDGFLPLSLAALGPWLFRSAQTFIEFPAGLIPTAPALIFMIFGFGVMLVKRRFWALCFGLILLLALSASAIHRYPLYGRSLLFMVPVALLMIAEGFSFIAASFKHKAMVTIPIVLALSMLMYPAGTALKQVIHQPKNEEARDVLAFLTTHRQPKDAVYLYYGIIPAFRYYSNKLHLDTAGLIIGASHRSEPGKYDAEVAQFSGNPRVWIVFSHYWHVNGISEEEIILTYCNSRGRVVDSYQCAGAAAYLYDFSSRRP